MQPTLLEICKKFNTDKSQSDGYILNYERHFSHFRDMPVKILELGVNHGGSLLLWQDYFLKGQVAGVDINPNPLKETHERVSFFQGSQGDHELLTRISKDFAPNGFDIIIDDAAHIGSLSKESFRVLFDKLKPGGVYVLEDWGTGYWKGWPDGSLYQPQQLQNNVSKSTNIFKKCFQKLGFIDVDTQYTSHNFGMVGLLKQLIDEVGWEDIVHPKWGNPTLPNRKSVIKEITIYYGQAFLVKA